VTAWLEQMVESLGYPGIVLLLALSRAIPAVPDWVPLPGSCCGTCRVANSGASACSRWSAIMATG
jgi:hypothetical protein